jgi:hypothetical protein
MRSVFVCRVACSARLVTVFLSIFCMLGLVACGASEAPPVATPEAKADYPGAGTAIDAQAKVLNDAKKIEQQQIDAAAERLKAVDGQ